MLLDFDRFYWTWLMQFDQMNYSVKCNIADQWTPWKLSRTTVVNNLCTYRLLFYGYDCLYDKLNNKGM